MIKLTSFSNEKNVFVNPLSISFFLESEDGGCKVYINDGDSSCLWVQESPEEVVKQMQPYIRPIIYFPNDNNIDADNLWK